MSILCIWIEDQHSTVFMKIPEQNSAVRQKIFEYGLSDTSQIAGDDPVIVRDISAGVDEVLTDGYQLRQEPWLHPCAWNL